MKRAGNHLEESPILRHTGGNQRDRGRELSENRFSQAAALASSADLVIVVIGADTRCEMPAGGFCLALVPGLRRIDLFLHVGIGQDEQNDPEDGLFSLGGGIGLPSGWNPEAPF